MERLEKALKKYAVSIAKDPDGEVAAKLEWKL